MKNKKNDEKDKNFAQIATNRKARHDYLIEDTIEAGIALEGPEVKSLRLKHCVITSAFARVENDGVYLYGMQISPYEFNTLTKLDPVRTRKLLLKKSEIRRLARAVEIKGMSLVALEVYFRRGWAKILLGLGKGKKAADKKETIKKRDIDREMRRDFSTKYKG